MLELDDIFMHDNASVHTARIVNNLVEEMGGKSYGLATLSPNLNSTENLWSLMKHEAHRLYSYLCTASGNKDAY